jgi:hypothetical protein
MRFQKRQTGAIKRATFLPIIPLVRQVIPSTDTDKAAFITFELKVCAGTGTGTPSYKKFMKTFEEGSPQEWMDVLTGLKEIWKQNSVNGATDRAATISAILKGDSLTAFETAMENARVNPDPEEDNKESNAPLDMTNEMVETCLCSVTETVFPFLSLETQKQWMLCYMKKPFDLLSKSMMTSLNRINNYLPSFPQANAASKFSDSEVIGLMEFALPPAWRKAFDLKGYMCPLMMTRRGWSMSVSALSAKKRPSRMARTKRRMTTTRTTKIAKIRSLEIPAAGTKKWQTTSRRWRTVFL